MSTEPIANKVLLVGWDAADWKVIHRLVDEGKMPCMSDFIDNGVIGNLATLYPELSPMLWTSIATGKRPHKHGILGFTEPNPDSGGVRPVTSLSRKTKAIWNILSLFGIKCVVIGWWPSHPVEPIPGVMISNHYHRATAPFGKPWPVNPASIYPPRLMRNLAALRLHPQELAAEVITDFVPHLAEIDQEKDRRIEMLAKIIAESATINRAATAVLHHEPWQFAAVYFDGIDHFGHAFMNYYPPKLPWIDESDFRHYCGVVENGYIFHDKMLAELIRVAGDDTTVMIVSDHGFHSDHLRPCKIPLEPAGPAVQHRPYGIFAIRGPAIKKDEIIYGASLLDITPTLLMLFGLPSGKDMDGRPLAGIFKSAPKMQNSIESWDLLAGEDGSHRNAVTIDPVEAKEAIDQLVALGYIEKPDDDRERAARECARELRYNLARSYMESGLYHEALRELSVLYGEYPDEFRFGIQLVECLLTLDRINDAVNTFDRILADKKILAKKSAKKLREIQEALKDKQSSELTDKEKHELRKLRAESSTNPYAMEYFRGSVLYAQKKIDQALASFQKAERISKHDPAVYNRLGEAYAKLKRWTECEESYHKALIIDPDNAEAYTGLASVAFSRGRFRDAVNIGMRATGLRFHNPKAHYIIGAALNRLGMKSEAINALKLAVHQNPEYIRAHRALARTFRSIHDNESALLYDTNAINAKKALLAAKRGSAGTQSAESLRRESSGLTSDELPGEIQYEIPPCDPANTVFVVSGLPRSGTSLMMQMLRAGGIPPFTDSERFPDEDNPKGYYEHRKATMIAKESGWLAEAKGMSVKIVAQLLRYLPKHENLFYRVIFMERAIDEVLASQTAMLGRQGKKASPMPEERMKEVFRKQLKQAKIYLAARRIPFMVVEYKECLTDPLTTTRINSFVGGGLNEAEMRHAVDPGLWRQKVLQAETKPQGSKSG